jgi:tetratricopeptide (TPR) repeat protein
MHESQAQVDNAAQCWNELAHGFAQKKSRHDAAIAHAKRALSLKQIAGLREELAQWLEGIGSWTEAAQLLLVIGEPKAGPDRARWHRRLASLWWRAGELEQAAQALAELARIDAECTEPLELLAGLHSNAPQLVSRERAVLAQLEAARRYQQRGARLAAFEAELRAFEIDPSSVLATEQLAISLGKLGRREAAEDIWRICAKLTADKSLHHAQLEKALGRDEFDRALGAALDGMSDTALSVNSAAQAVEFTLQPHGSTPKTFEGVLARARLYGWLAARLEMAVIESRSREQSKAWILLTRLYASAMGRPDLALQSLARALVIDPGSPELRRMIEAFTDEGHSVASRTALVGALRVGVSPEVRTRLASDFIELAENEGAAPCSLVAWAFDVLEQAGMPSIQHSSADAWKARKRAQQQEFTRALATVDSLPDHQARVQMLQQVASAMALDPDALLQERDVLLKWLCLEPACEAAIRRLAQLIEILSWRISPEPITEEWVRALEVLCDSAGDTGVTAAASYWLRQGIPEQALRILRHAIERPEPSERLLGWLVTLARRMSDGRLYAEGLCSMAKVSEPPIAAMLLAHAAESFLELADAAAARRAVDAGLALAPASARLVGVDVRLQDVRDSRALAETLERALGVIPPRAQFAFQLAEAHQNLGNSELALAWAQRASTLQPSAAPLRRRVAELAIAANDTTRMAEWLLRSIDIPAPIETWLPMAVRVLEALVRCEPPRAAEVVRRLLTATGVADASWRAALLMAADAVSDTQLALDILERAVASGNDVELALRDIVRRRLQLGDFEAAYEGGLRAVRFGVPREEVREWVSALLETDSYQVAETELAAAELAWELTRRGTDADAITRAMRRLAKDRLLLARDQSGAFEIWSALLSMQHTEVLDIVATDLVPSLGPVVAIERLSEWGASASDPKRQAAYCVASAYLYAQTDDVQRAKLFLERALSCDATNVDALLIAESQVAPSTDCDWLEEIYGIAESAIFGQHGGRALHYRAAKILEARGESARALRHACAAFTALPSPGVVFRLMASLTRAVGDAQPFVDALWMVAARGGQQGVRWIQLALAELERTEAFLTARFELLLRALTLDTSVGIVQKAAEAARSLIATAPSDGELASLRLARALRAKLDAAKGPQGARLALVMASTAVSLTDFQLCAQGLHRAFQCDADVDEYAEAEATVHWLGQDAGTTKRVLLDVLGELDKPYINVGFEALKVLGWLQMAGGDSETLQALIALAARLGRRESFLAWLGEVLESSTSSNPGSGAVLKELVEIRLHEDRLDDALQLLCSIINSNPRTELAYESARQGITLLTEHRDLDAAKQWIHSIRESLTPVHAATLELELARGFGEGLPLIQALAHVAYSDPSSPARGMAYLQEATELADRLGFTAEALDCAKSAVAWDPDHAAAQLQLATILYKLRDRDGDDHAEEIVSALRKLPVQTRPEDEEMRAFILAEALDAAYGTGTGTDELVRAHARFGNLPLVALGLAERLVLAGDNAPALPLFELAVRGDLRGLRSVASVCLEAARVARSERQLPTALGWLQRATREATCPSAAKELIAEIERELRSEQTLEQTSVPGHAASSPMGVETGNAPAERNSARIRRDVPLMARDADGRDDPSDEEPAEIPLVRRRTEKPPSTPRPKASRAAAAVNHDSEAEPDSVEQAVARARSMIERASPSYQTLTVLRRWLRRWPASTLLMTHVRDAAFVERDIPLSRAVEHARSVLLGATERIEPPELSAQPIVPEAVRLLLAKDLLTPVGEALAVLWEGAEHLLQRDLMDYGVTGLDRVVPNASNALWQVASDLAPRLDLLKVPLFHRRGAEPMTARVALSNPPALVLQGELPRNSRDLIGLVGASLWITQPAYSLLMSAPGEYVKIILLALQLAFGPPQRHPMTNMNESLRLAEKLWECVPSSAQRHLRELCLDSLDYELARESAQCAQRRAGLYATGDLHWALTDLSGTEGYDVLTRVAEPDLAETLPHVADLLRLATSAEYAAVRWQPSRSSERRIDVLQR